MDKGSSEKSMILPKNAGQSSKDGEGLSLANRELVESFRRMSTSKANENSMNLCCNYRHQVDHIIWRMLLNCEAAAHRHLNAGYDDLNQLPAEYPAIVWIILQ